MKRGHLSHGSLQFYPRKRSAKILPRTNWNIVTQSGKNVGLLGFIGYKIGMKSAYVKDETANSMMKGKRIIIPVTLIECPPLKILSVRVYKNGKIVKESMNAHLEKELQRKITMPKSQKSMDDFLNDIEKNHADYDDMRMIVYSLVKKTGLKKRPDIIEVGLAGTMHEKIAFVRQHMNKELTIKDFATEEIVKKGLIDLRGVTKGKGFQGSTKRFGLDLLPHKTEKGIRGPGSGGAWHPARVEFRQPMAGQMGFFTRIVYNSKIIHVGDIQKNPGVNDHIFHHFGKINTDYVVLAGSVQGPTKRPLLLTAPLRPTKKQIKKNFEFIELR